MSCRLNANHNMNFSVRPIGGRQLRIKTSFHVSCSKSKITYLSTISLHSNVQTLFSLFHLLFRAFPRTASRKSCLSPRSSGSARRKSDTQYRYQKARGAEKGTRQRAGAGELPASSAGPVTGKNHSCMLKYHVTNNRRRNSENKSMPAILEL